MKLFSSEHLFNYSWEQVTAANWQKYPNELSTHVVAVDILGRTIDQEKRILRTERLLTCKQPVPKWLSYLTGGLDHSYVREVSEVDLINKTLVMKSHNLTMNHLLEVNETVIYRPDKDLPQARTLFDQSAEIRAYASFKKICEKIEDWSVERFGQNAIIGKRGFELVLENLSKGWLESGEIVSEVGNSLIRDLNEVGDKTQSVLQEVSKLTNVLSK